jgi:Aspartyl/Asparaginyl beta-hydroxylase
MRQMDQFRSAAAPKKELYDFNFKFYKTFNVDNISSKVQELSDEWNLDKFRQNARYPERRNPHLYTHTFTIQNHDIDWNFGDKIDSEIKDARLLAIVSDIVKDLELMCGGVSGRVLLIKLSANKDVSEHTDKGDYLSTVRRFHIPIITNDLVSYTVNGEKINMKQGECWEINNLKSHSVLNDSNTDRVHLLIDIFPTSSKETIDIIDTDDV